MPPCTCRCTRPAQHRRVPSTCPRAPSTAAGEPHHNEKHLRVLQLWLCSLDFGALRGREEHKPGQGLFGAVGVNRLLDLCCLLRRLLCLLLLAGSRLFCLWLGRGQGSALLCPRLPDRQRRWGAHLDAGSSLEGAFLAFFVLGSERRQWLCCLLLRHNCLRLFLRRCLLHLLSVQISFTKHKQTSCWSLVS